MSTSKISRKGLTTVPKEIRKALELSEGDRIAWRLKRAGASLVVEIEAIKDPMRYLKGHRNDKTLTYQRLEEKADQLIIREASG